MKMAAKTFNDIRHFLLQLLFVLTASLSSFSDGMHFGWTAPALPILRSENTPIEITLTDETWLEGTYMIGALIVTPLSIYLLDKLGRKYSLMISSTVSLLAWIIIGVSGRIEYVYFGRILAGACSGFLWTAGPSYISEISDKNYRGFFLTMFVLMSQTGILVVYLLGLLTIYYVPSVVGAMVLFLQLVAFSTAPKTPYFLLSQKKTSEAEAVLRQLRKEYHENELEEMVKAVEKQSENKGGFRDLIFMKSNRNAAINCIVLIGLQSWSGYCILVMNVHTIIQEAESIHITPELSGIIFSAVMFVALFISSTKVDSFGRKKLLVVSGILSGVSMLTSSIYFILKAAEIDLKSMSFVPSIATAAYAISFRLGLGFVPQVLAGELFSHNVKATGLALVDISFQFFGLTSLYFYHYFFNVSKIEIPFFVFATVSFISVFYTVYAIPETKGKTLEEIQMTVVEDRQSS